MFAVAVLVVQPVVSGLVQHRPGAAPQVVLVLAVMPVMAAFAAGVASLLQPYGLPLAAQL